MAKAIPAREVATSGADGVQIKKRRMKALLKTKHCFYAPTAKVQPSDTKILHRQQSTNIY